VTKRSRTLEELDFDDLNAVSGAVYDESVHPLSEQEFDRQYLVDMAGLIDSPIIVYRGEY